MNVNNFIYWLLNAVPVDVLGFSLWFLCVGILHFGRWRYEGLSYNISMASELGDTALIFAGIRAAGILQGRPFEVGLGMEYWHMLALLLGATFSSAYVGLTNKPGQTKMDFYHNIFVAPLLFVLIFLSLPVVIQYGNWKDIVAFFSYIAVWVALLGYDGPNGRLQQPAWLKKHLPEYLERHGFIVIRPRQPKS